MLEQHHRYSASGGKGWMLCSGKITMEKDFEDTSSSAADDGSASHYLGGECLQHQVPVSDHLGKRIQCWERPSGRDGQNFIGEPMPKDAKVRSTWMVDSERVEYVQGYCDFVNAKAAGGELLVEERVHFGGAIGIPGAFGTSDVIIIFDTKIVIIDLKYGFKRVDAENNPQMMLYALGTLETLGLIYDLDAVTSVEMIIYQPRIDNFSEWECSVEELGVFADKAKAAVDRSEEALGVFESGDYDVYVWEETYLRPSEEGCMWCKAKGVCNAYAKDSITTMVAGAATGDGLVDLDDHDLVSHTVEQATRNLPRMTFTELVACYAAIGQIQEWVKGVEAQMLTEMLKGNRHPKFKLIKGRAGNRAWMDDAEAAMKTMRFKEAEMYDRKLVSVTTAEKTIAKAHPRQWKKLEALICRSEGKVCVVPTEHKSPSINPYDDDLAMLPELALFDPDDFIDTLY